MVTKAKENNRIGKGRWGLQVGYVVREGLPKTTSHFVTWKERRGDLC